SSLGEFLQIVPMDRGILAFSVQSLKIKALLGLGHDNADSIGGAELDGLFRISVLKKRCHLRNGDRRQLFFFIELQARFHGRSLQQAWPQFAEELVACIQVGAVDLSIDCKGKTDDVFSVLDDGRKGLEVGLHTLSDLFVFHGELQAGRGLSISQFFSKLTFQAVLKLTDFVPNSVLPSETEAAEAKAATTEAAKA